MQSVTMTPEMCILLLPSHDELPRPYHADEAHFLVNKTGQKCVVYIKLSTILGD